MQGDANCHVPEGIKGDTYKVRCSGLHNHHHIILLLTWFSAQAGADASTRMNLAALGLAMSHAQLLLGV